ncbi:MAG: ABC transporter permease [archaeon GB-1867-035]|nr:ABC transporter permease [Candidatus Culexmicrobium profundum]
MSLLTVALKEFSDHVTSRRFLILFILLSILTVLSAFSSASRVASGFSITFSDVLTSGSLSIIYLIGQLGPLIGIALGFDSISKEMESGSILLLLSCPIYRDTILNGKILSGLLTILLTLGTSITLLTGFILAQPGIAPTIEELIRLLIYFVFAVIYILAYMALSLLTSIITKKTSMSLLISISTWIFFTYLIHTIASSIASLLPETDIEGRIRVLTMISLLSPYRHYNTFSRNIISPKFSIDPFSIFPRKSPFKPLTLMESLALSWPNLIIILSLLIIFLAASYIKFLKEEVR